MDKAVNIPDRLLLSGPNGGGLGMLSRSRFEQLFTENATGVSIAGKHAAWVVQDAPANSLHAMVDGRLSTVRLSDGALDLHDILIDGPRFWAVATQINAILCIEQDREVGRWQYAAEPDSWHVNCLVRHAGRMLASTFGRFDATRGYKGNTRGNGEVFDVKTGAPVIRGLSQPHSLVSEDGLLWLCDSEAGEVHAYDEDRRVRALRLPGYTRGLAFGRDHVYVGISRTRNEPGGKVERRFDTAVIAVLNRATGEPIGYVPVPWSEIYDIRVLKSPQLAEDLLLAGLTAQAEQRRHTARVAEMADLTETVNRQHAEVINAISEDIRNMQETLTATLERASRVEGKAEIAEQLAGRIEQLGAAQGALPAAYAEQLRVAVKESIAPVLDKLDATHAGLTAEAGEHGGINPLLSDLASTVTRQHAEVIHAISEDIRTMQTALTSTLQQAARNEGKIEIAERLGDRWNAEQARLHAALVPLAALAEDMPVGLQQVRSQLDSLAQDAQQSQASLREAAESIVSMFTTNGDSFSALGKIHVMVDQLSTAMHELGSAERLAKEERLRLEGEIARVSGMPGLQDRIEAVVADRERWRITSMELEQRADELQRELAEERHARQAIAEALDERRRANEALEQDLRQNNHALAVLRSEAEGLRAVADQHRQLVNSFSWRSTRPLRVAKRLITGQRLESDSDRLRSAWRKLLVRIPIGGRIRSRLIGRALANGSGLIEALPDQHVAPAVELAPVPDLPDVFVWSVIDFHFRVQRPQHLARAMAAKGHRVFYISVNFRDLEQPGFHLDPIDGCGRLFQIHLNLAGQPLIYSQMPSDEQVEALRRSLAELLAWTCSRSSISLVQHPYWSAVVRSVPNARVVYDCMDHHAGFDNNSPAVLAAERHLIEESELVIVTSAWLEEDVSKAAAVTAIVRNAGEFQFFRDRPGEVFADPHGRKVIGYFGAIASWFDFDLVRRVAEEHPDALVVLVGHDSVGGTSSIKGLPNVLMVGEVPYARLPYWLHGFDVCLLPFKVIPLTLATNPVKVYEYLAAGKPTVAVDLPEMAQFNGLIRTAADADSFVAAVSASLAESGNDELAAARQAFAATQTWIHRAAELDEVLSNLDEPRVSVVVLTYNNLAFTQACLHSIEVHSDYRNLEVIVVDNASSDDSPEYLARWVTETSAAGHTRRLILNDRNVGFAAGNNIGLEAATGDILVLLNNDVFVTPGWVRTMRAHLVRNPNLGLVGPVTNNIGNEARIEINYRDMAEMVEYAGHYTRRHAGKAFPISTVAFFCVMMPRHVYEAIGGLDEAFGLGFFEDDDYCRRVQGSGWDIACAEDVFIHHHLSASFDQVGAERKRELFETNKGIYEAKWGKWTPHVYRPTAE